MKIEPITDEQIDGWKTVLSGGAEARKLLASKGDELLDTIASFIARIDQDKRARFRVVN